MGENPVKEGIVTRLDHPGGNITGFSNFTNGLFSKRLGLLRDLAPRAHQESELAVQRSDYPA
jgi:hypothetical protein